MEKIYHVGARISDVIISLSFILVGWGLAILFFVKLFDDSKIGYGVIFSLFGTGGLIWLIYNIIFIVRRNKTLKNGVTKEGTIAEIKITHNRYAIYFSAIIAYENEAGEKCYSNVPIRKDERQRYQEHSKVEIVVWKNFGSLIKY